MLQGRENHGGKAGSGKNTCPSQALMHRNLAGKWALMQQINIPVCFSEYTNNSEQLIPQCLTALNISLSSHIATKVCPVESFLLYAKTSCAPLRGGCRGFRVPFTGVQRRETATVTLLVQSLRNCSLLYIF